MTKESAIKNLLTDLKENGFRYKNIDALLKKNVLKLDEVNIILKWLLPIYQEELGTGAVLVQSLKASEVPFDPKELIRIFEEGDLNSSIKSSIGFILSYAKTTDISEWIKDQVLNKPYSFERAALIRGVVNKGGFNNTITLKKFLEPLFEKYPLMLLDVYNDIGDDTDVDFFLEKMYKADKGLAKEIQKTLRKIVKKKNSAYK